MDGQMRSWVVRVGVGLGLLVLVPQMAFADWSWRRPFTRHHHDYDRYGAVVVLPVGAAPIVVGESTYYYWHGVYYRHGPRGFVVVPAPVGAVVPVIPNEQQTIVIDGVTYHEYGGVYYKGGPAGYTVVPVYQGNGVGALTTTPPTVASASAANEKSSVVVNIPNKNGSYTPITLQLAGNGMYIGPQGEVYPNLPAIGQLQAMYGK